MTDRDSILRLIRREAGRYGHAPETAEAIERLAQLIERHEDRARPAPTIPASEWTKTGNVGH